jgi:catechol 2,3-dioxygenase-like lactoylglutathione lyase family enzyme
LPPGRGGHHDLLHRPPDRPCASASQGLPKTRKFYEAVFAVLGLKIAHSSDNSFQLDELYVDAAGPDTPPTHVHLAFQAKDRVMVDAVYAAAMAAGGKDNGAPGERPYHPGYYGAFVLDPDGNNIEAVFHGPSTRSADAVRIEAV